MKITFNNYMSGYNNTIYINMRNNTKVNMADTEMESEQMQSATKNSSNNKVFHQNIVNTEINLENNMLYYYRSQELKRRKAETKEEKIKKIRKL